jgi:hypothetical protein
VLLQLKEMRKKTGDMTGEVFEQKNELAMENLFLALDDSFMFNMAEGKTVKGIGRYL